MDTKKIALTPAEKLIRQEQLRMAKIAKNERFLLGMGKIAYSELVEARKALASKPIHADFSSVVFSSPVSETKEKIEERGTLDHPLKEEKKRLPSCFSLPSPEKKPTIEKSVAQKVLDHEMIGQQTFPSHVNEMKPIERHFKKSVEIALKRGIKWAIVSSIVPISSFHTWEASKLPKLERKDRYVSSSLSLDLIREQAEWYRKDSIIRRAS